MARNRSGAGAAAGFIISSVLSVVAGIASVVMMYMKWVEINLFSAVQQYSLIELYSGIKELHAQMLDSINSFTSILGEEPLTAIPGLERMELVTLGILAVAGLMEIIQVLYIIAVLGGQKSSRARGLVAGILTLLLAAASIAMLYYLNLQINTELTSLNQTLGSVNDTLNGLGSMVQSILPDFNLGTANLYVDANEIIKITIYPVITGVLGLLEAVLAR